MRIPSGFAQVLALWAVPMLALIASHVDLRQGVTAFDVGFLRGRR